MAAVSQKTLNWLYSVLTSEYHDVNRTYNDVAQALSQYPSLSPRTDVYTYETGASALLLHLSGTLPVPFRGTVYQFPISIWVPYTYPREAPLVYVTPTPGMMIRPGQHVSGEGRVYHPYIAGWATFWDKSNLVDLLSVLQDVFAKEPPVVSQQQQRQSMMSPQLTSTSSPPPVPPLPPELDNTPTRRSQPVASQATPPPPPPKPGKEGQPLSLQTRGAAPPPVPPLPERSSMSHLLNEQRVSNGPVNDQLRYSPQRPVSLRDGIGRSIGQSSPGIPPQPTPYSPISPIMSQPPIYQRSPPQQQQNYNFQPPLAGPIQHPMTGSHAPPQSVPQPNIIQPSMQPTTTTLQPIPAHLQPSTPTSKPKPQPTEDLLSSPLTLPDPSQSTNTSLVAPPIPPNPEKDLLLQTVGTTLYENRQNSIRQTQSTLQSLQSQRLAMLDCASRIQSELESLHALDATLTSNERILAESMRRADEVMNEAKSRTVPKVEELLVAPTVVGQQLYRVVAEERALGDAMFVLSRALDKGRVGLDVFLKQTRSLAREQFLKMALEKKIAKGMGLILDDAEGGSSGSSRR